MICTFFGHKDTSNIAEDKLKKAIAHLIEKEGVNEFYVGNNGNFDFLVQSVLQKVSTTNRNVNFTIVLSYLNERAMIGEQSLTIFPEGLEKVPPRFAISKRNDWLIKKADFVIAYMEHKLSNCHKWIEKAMRSGLKVINLVEHND